MNILDVIFLWFIIILSLIWYKSINMIDKINKKEKELSENRFYEGSDIVHGMVITKNGLEGDEKPALNWISKHL